MALRGWRLFGVAGTISVYLAGILLLSFMSLNGPPQRNQFYRSGGRYDFDGLRHHEVNMVAKRQPLQWCQPLRYLDSAAGHQVPNEAAAAAPIRRPLQTFAGHYVHSRTAHSALPLQSSAIAHANDAEEVVGDDGRRRPRSRPSTPAKTPALATGAGRADAGGTQGKQKSKHSTAAAAAASSGLGKTTPRHGGDKEQQQQQQQHQMRKKRTNQKEIKQLSDSAERNLIALASFPGSGNTWLRYLLQQATGIYTGSVYKDFGLLKSGFPAENVFNSSVLVVKTHEWGEKSYIHFAKAILLVRDPDKAIQAEFNRQSGGHVGFAAPDRYKRTKGRYWQQFFAHNLATWGEMNMHWARNYTGALKIVYYDDLIADVENTLRSVLHFIRYPVNEDLLACAVQRKEGIYRRKKRIMTFDPFTAEMHVQLEAKKRHVYSELGRYRF